MLKSVGFHKKKYAVDRHIPHRAGENFDVFHYDFTANIFEMDEIWPPTSRAHLNYAQKFFKRRCYVEGLWKLVAPKSRRILNFSVSNGKENEDIDDSSKIWSVVSRKRPLITYPLLILDLPEVNTDLRYDTIDWNKNDQIAAICDGAIYIWSEENSKIVLITGSPAESIKNCLKFSCDGRLLAVAHDQSRIVVFDIYNQVVLRWRCCKTKSCSISSLVWSTDGVLTSGCTNGNLTSWFKNVRRSIRAMHKGAIIGMHYSCSEKYLATSGMDNTVQVRTWPELQLIFKICNSLPVKAFAWHPWQEPLMVCAGGEINNKLSVWNVCNREEVHQRESAVGVSVDALTFNKKSGELVVSFCSISRGRTFIAVLPHFGTISDGVIWHLGRVPYLLWNSDSTRLLTAGSDEYTCIWNFFGGNGAPKLKAKRKEKSSLSPIDCLNCFKSTIR